ncbi:MAG: tol-pal system protein YbgF [Proteobacteria bacterium]|nr:tol-pal system protein YbgF [Pseudomonadota bacterium]
MLKASINNLGPLGKNSLIPRIITFFPFVGKGKRHILKLVVLLVLLGFYNFGCALHKDVLTLDNRVGQLRLRVVTLENQTSQLNSKTDGLKKKTEEIKDIESEKENKIRGQAAEQYADIQRHTEEIQILNGRVEVLEHLLNQKLNALEETAKIAESRLAKVEQTTEASANKLKQLDQYLSLEGKEKTTLAGQTDTTENTKQEIPENEMYASALKLYDKEKYAAAREQLQEMLKKYPNSDIADNCQFWIGESYYREKWYEKAIGEYQKVIEKYPKGNKMKASLLKQGLSFYNIGDKKTSKLILNQLVEKFPDSIEAKTAESKLKGF